jgi:hypothetical protein
MATLPMAIRFDEEVRSLLKEGARRTPLTKQELVRRTLRLHLRSVIDEEASTPVKRLTNVEPWPRGVLARALRKTEKDWEQIEAAATAARPKPRWDD